MKKLTLLLLTFISFWTIGQVSTDKRLEFELADGYYGETIYEFGEEGFVLVSNSKAKGGEINWKYEKYDNDLELVGKNDLDLDKQFYDDGTFRTEDKLYTLFKSKKGDYKIVWYDVANASFEEISGALKKKTYIKGMKILGDYAYFAATYKKAPYVYTINLKNGEQSMYEVEFEGVNPKRTTIENMQLLPDSDEIFLMVKATLSKTESDMYIVRMGNTGNYKGHYNFSEGSEYKIIDATASPIGKDKYIITGTYSSKRASSSDGMYFSIVEDERISSINYYNFTDLDNFLNYLPERKQEKIERKKKRKEDRGKELKLSYWLAAHNIIEVNDGYMFLAEAYYPTYRLEAKTTTTFVNGVAQTTTTYEHVFDGYQYTHAFFAKFDKSGELQWDNSFKMWIANKPFYVKRFINIAEQTQEAIKLVFATGNQIVSKSFGFDGSVISDFMSDEIESEYDTDKVKRSFSNISFWYGNYFLAYGTQKIKNKVEGDKRKRKVYFINKIEFKLDE